MILHLDECLLTHQMLECVLYADHLFARGNIRLNHRHSEELHLTTPSSMGKTRKLGWHGYVDSHQGIFATMNELAELKMVPPVPNSFEQEIRYVGYQLAI